jgi:hypothetical protein
MNRDHRSSSAALAPAEEARTQVPDRLEDAAAEIAADARRSPDAYARDSAVPGGGE